MNAVVSVNVGLPRDIEWQGKTVRTAIWKQAVAGRVKARRLNLDGDGQGDLQGHGGENRAVMVYQLASYRYWQDHFKEADFSYGHFGENLTVEGLADTEVCIGDRFRIGGALFEVTQPRVTCYRVAIRTNYAEMPALLVSHRRPGFYLRVLKEGEIGAGDEIVKISDGPEGITVAEMDALLYLPDHPGDTLERALQIPALSLGWQGSLRALLTATKNERAGSADISGAAPLSWAGFRPLKVVSSVSESDDVRSFELAAPDGSPLPAALPGQFVIVKLRPSRNAIPLVRNYSLSGPPGRGTYRISVKREAQGAASSYLHEHMAAGSTLEASAPRGSFILADGAGPVVFLSAGIGITPVLAMLYALAGTQASVAREIWWIYGARNGKRHAFAHETRDLVAKLKNGKVFTVYSRPDADDRLGKYYDAEGRVDLPLLQRLGVPREADFHLCGPAGFIDTLIGGLKLWGVAQSRIRTEAFGPATPLMPGVVTAKREAPHRPAGEPGAGPSVTFIRSGLTLPWDKRYNSLLEFAEACAVPVRWSCRAGVCHNCESALIDGRVRYSPEPLDPPPAGNVLICCSTPITEIQLDL